jgi:hypothetical protein
MSNITTYPGIPIVAGDDLMIISDVSVEGNPTRSVSVNQLGAYIGAAGGGGAGVASINALAGAITLVGGTNITLTPVGQVITINSTAENGTVTSVSSTAAGSALNVAVTNPTTTPAVAFTWSGANTQYVNGAGNVANISTLIASGALTLTTTGTSGAAALVGNNLNVPQYTTPYTSYVQLLSQTSTNAPSGPVLENSAGLTNITWTRTGAGLYVGTFGLVGIADVDKVAIMIHNGIKASGGAFTASINAFTNTTDFKLEVFDAAGTFTDTQLLRATLEIRIYP